MKKFVCWLSVLVMCLCLTGCASEKSLDLTGEWYMISNVEKEEETHSWTWSPFEGFDVSNVSDELQFLQDVDGTRYFLWPIHKEPSGQWRDYKVDLDDYDDTILSFGKGKIARFKMGDEFNATSYTYKLSGSTLSVKSDSVTILEGPIERWDKDVLFWDVAGDADILLIRRDSVVNDRLWIKN